DCTSNGGERGALQTRGLVGGDEAVVLAREPVLLELRVERGKGVLPTPDHQGPRQRRDAGDDERGAENTKAFSHRAWSTTTVVVPAIRRNSRFAAGKNGYLSCKSSRSGRKPMHQIGSKGGLK